MALLLLLACNPPESAPESCGSDRQCVNHHLEVAHGYAVSADAWTVIPLIEDARNENARAP
jgi:hypothetical protein